MNRPIPVCGVPATVRPATEIPIRLCWDARREGIIWGGGEPVSKAEVETAINLSRGHYLPNGILLSLRPDDVLVLSDGIFWIGRDWLLQRIEVGDDPCGTSEGARP